MTCENIHHLLSLYVMNDLADGEKDLVERHIADCSDCRGEVKVLREVIENVRAAGVPDPGEKFWERFEMSVMGRVGHLEENNRRSIGDLICSVFPVFRDLGFTRTFAYTASIVCVVLLGGLFTWRAHLRYSNPLEGFSPSVLSYQSLVEDNIPYTDYLDSMTDDELAVVSSAVTGLAVGVSIEHEETLLEYEKHGSYQIYTEIDLMGDEELDLLIEAIDKWETS